MTWHPRGRLYASYSMRACPLGGTHGISTGSFAAWCSVGKRAPKNWIGPVHGALSIRCGYTGVWAGMWGKIPLGFAATMVCPKGTVAWPQLADGEVLRRWLEPHLKQVWLYPSLAKSRKRTAFDHASAHDGETVQRGASVREGFQRGGGVRAGEGAWGHPDAGRVRMWNKLGRRGLKVRAFTPCLAAHGGSAMAVLGLALTAAERRQAHLKDLVMPRGGGIGSLQISETKAAVKLPICTTDVVPVLPRVSVLPVQGRYYRQGRVYQNVIWILQRF
jgi:hypothetical protein